MENESVRTMRTHVTVEDLLRFSDGSASADETLGLGRHLAECSHCAALAQEMFRDAAPAALAASLRGEPAPRPRWRGLLAIAAAVALAVGAALAVAFLRNNGPTRTPPVASTHAAPRAGADAYDRAEWHALVHQALERGIVVVAAPTVAAAEGDALRGPSNGLEGKMTPSATAVESARPLFSWPEVKGAQFVVHVVAGDDVVLRSATLHTNRWQADKPLARGETYAWQVRVMRGHRVDTLPSPPHPIPRFRVLADDEVRELADARESHPRDHLLLGVVAAHHGLLDDARRELAAYAAEHPSPEAARLAASVAGP
jgi:hypothetical protein